MIQLERHRATLTSKGQLTMPILVREFLKISEGEEIDFSISAEGFVYVSKVEKKEDEVIQMINAQELLTDIKKIVNKLKLKGQTEVLTVDVIREHQGNYYNANTSPKKSWNAKFGKFLKDNQTRLGLREIKKDVNTFDDNKNPTSCSLWEII